MEDQAVQVEVEVVVEVLHLRQHIHTPGMLLQYGEHVHSHVVDEYRLVVLHVEEVMDQQ